MRETRADSAWIAVTARKGRLETSFTVFDLSSSMARTCVHVWLPYRIISLLLVKRESEREREEEETDENMLSR